MGSEGQIVLKVQPRKTGKQGLNERSETDVIGVVYGKEVKPTPFSVHRNDINKVFRTAGTNQIVDLEIDGGESHEVVFKDIQYDPVMNTINHVDLYAVRRGEKLTTSVPIELVDDAPAEASGKHIAVVLEEVEVTTVPRKIPEKFIISRSNLAEIGDTLTVADIKITDEEIEIGAEAETLIAKVEEIKEMKVEDDQPEATPEGDEEGEEGDEAEGEESGEESDQESSEEA